MKILIKTLFLITIVFFIISCSKKNSKELITDEHIVINKRVFSKDSTKMILIYQYDIGALGYGSKRTVIINTKDSLLDLSDKHIQTPDLYTHNVRWISNETIQIERDTLIINDDFTDKNDTIINGIKIIYLKK